MWAIPVEELSASKPVQNAAQAYPNSQSKTVGLNSYCF